MGEHFITAAAAAGATKLGSELADIAGLEAAHGREALVAALARATSFGRFALADVRSILATGAGAPRPAAPGDALVLELPQVPRRSLAEYARGGAAS